MAQKQFEIGVPVFFSENVSPQRFAIARTPVSVTYAFHNEESLLKLASERGLHVYCLERR